MTAGLPATSGVVPVIGLDPPSPPILYRFCWRICVPASRGLARI